MWRFALAALAFAQDAPAVDASGIAEEIIVWGDPFLRWDRRWVVETEVHFADLFRLFADNNLESRLTNMQMRVVLDCDRDIQLGPKRWEVRCVVEDIGLVALTTRPGTDDTRVLQEADAAMTGAILELQVSADGGVPNVGLERFAPRNERDRQRQEQYRQLLSRVTLPFHLGMPPVVADGVKWYEYNSRLMSMPSNEVSGGSTTLAHFMDVFEGHLLVQTVGEGVMRPTTGVEGIGTDADGMAAAVTRPVDTYDTTLHGVAVFDLETGVMEERVWALGSVLTASSPNVLRGLSYGHRGRLRMLGELEAPDVGTTHLARFSPTDDGVAPVWVPLATQ